MYTRVQGNVVRVGRSVGRWRDIARADDNTAVRSGYYIVVMSVKIDFFFFSDADVL